MKKEILKNVSDGLCDKNYELINFDSISNYYSSVDGLMIEGNNFIFVEFKNLEYVSLLDWISNRCKCEETGITYEKKIKCNKESVLLKGYESFLLYKSELFSIYQKDLKDKKVWFIFVYSHNDSSKKDKKFKEHFKRNIFNRLKIIYDESRIISCDKFLKFLEKIKGEK